MGDDEGTVWCRRLYDMLCLHVVFLEEPVDVPVGDVFVHALLEV